jgi:hypothetical protein
VTSNQLPGNPFVEKGTVDYAYVDPEQDGATAIFALAYEQRTANLVALYGALLQANRPIVQTIPDQIYARLGVDSRLGR